MLAHNATIHEVPYEWGALVDAAAGDPYVVGLSMVSERVKRTRDEAERNARTRSGG